MQDAVHGQFKLDEPWDSETNLKMLQQIAAVYRSASSQRTRTHTYYQAFAGPGTPLHPTVLPGGEAAPNSEAGWRRVRDGKSGQKSVDPEIFTMAHRTRWVLSRPVRRCRGPSRRLFDPQKPVKLVAPF